MEASQQSGRIREAYEFAKNAHAGQVRKIGGGDYFDDHVARVAALVSDYGGSDDEIVAALLHDTVEDQGVSLDEIAERFGPVVASYVDYVSERKKSDGSTYRDRKTDYIRRLAEAPLGALRVCLADKVHNSESTYASARVGIDVVAEFPSFHWYYDHLLAAFATRLGEFDYGMHEMHERIIDAVDAVARYE